jgi:hypothetical protein
MKPDPIGKGMDALNKRLDRMVRKAEHAAERAKRKPAGLTIRQRLRDIERRLRKLEGIQGIPPKG